MWRFSATGERRGVGADTDEGSMIDSSTTRREDSVSNNGMMAPDSFTTFVTTQLANSLAVCVMWGTLIFVAIGAYIGWSLGEELFDVPEGWSLDAALALFTGGIFGGGIGWLLAVLVFGTLAVLLDIRAGLFQVLEAMRPSPSGERTSSPSSERTEVAADFFTCSQCGSQVLDSDEVY